MSSGLSNEIDSGPSPGTIEVRETSVDYACNLRKLTASFNWRWPEDLSPERQWLEMSLFKDRWTPDGQLVIQSSLAPEAVSVSLSVEPDSVYYWRLRVESDGQIFTTAAEQFHTPSCIADFVDGS